MKDLIIIKIYEGHGEDSTWIDSVTANSMDQVLSVVREYADTYYTLVIIEAPK